MRLTIVAMLLLAGCKTLVPYDSKFACEGTQDFGRCMDVQTAYQDALSGTPAARKLASPGRESLSSQHRNIARATGTATLKRRSAQQSRGKPLTVPTGEELYRDAKYRELAGLIEDSVTPLVQAPKVLRTLVVPYSAGGSLYMPRYVYFLADEAKFVLGDYLKGDPAPKVLFPNTATNALSDGRH